MYNIIQLNNKEVSELQDIAAEMGIKGAKSLERQDLIYRILDEQAIAGAQKKVASEEAKGDRRQRTRINKKEVANKVYSADKDKAEKINDTPKIVATPINEEKKEEVPLPQPTNNAPTVKEEVQTEVQDQANADKAPQGQSGKKRGRKPKAQQNNAPANQEEQPQAVQEQGTTEAPAQVRSVVASPRRKRNTSKKSPYCPSLSPATHPSSRAAMISSPSRTFPAILPNCRPS